jgi:hypothetical protein
MWRGYRKKLNGRTALDQGCLTTLVQPLFPFLGLGPPGSASFGPYRYPLSIWGSPKRLNGEERSSATERRGMFTIERNED